jgi:hypothetical protein
MRVVDLKALPAALAASVADTKEAVVDALLNLTWQRASGAGPNGARVFGTKPSLRFVSGFLLPRFEETGQQDETSDIHISTHGLDLQVAAGAKGPLTVRTFSAIYVRALPTWSEITRPELDLFPNPPLRPDLEANIRATMRDRLRAALAAEETKPSEQRRQRGELAAKHLSRSSRRARR